MSGPFKCLDCGTWWAWPSEHRCPPAISANSSKISASALPSSPDADASEPEGNLVCRPSQESGVGAPTPPAPTGDAAPRHSPEPRQR